MNASSLTCNLKDFSASYKSIHGYLSIFVCVFGSIANILNICVLTRKEMRIPTNFILTALAVADLLVMFEYIPFACRYLQSPSRFNVDHSYLIAFYMYFHALFSQIGHFISCCLTIILAVWRYIAISKPQHNADWCNLKKTKLAIFLTYFLCPFICIPLLLAQTISPEERQAYLNFTLIYKNVVNLTDPSETRNVTIYVLKMQEKYTIGIWVYCVVIKLIPCVLLTILSICLIDALLTAKKRHKILCNSSGIPLVNGNAEKQQRNLDKEKQANRTTRMLLAVLLLFLLTEFPQAIMGLLSILNMAFLTTCYVPLGDVMDILALTNSAINFILYCSMSQQFRSVFKRLFVPERFSSNMHPKSEETMLTQLAHV